MDMYPVILWDEECEGLREWGNMETVQPSKPWARWQGKKDRGKDQEGEGERFITLSDVGSCDHGG
jgi:hypothetical protein